MTHKSCKFSRVFFFIYLVSVAQQIKHDVYTQECDFSVSTFQTLLGGVWWNLSIIFPDSIVLRLRSKVRNMAYDKYSQQYVKICQNSKKHSTERMLCWRGIFGEYTLMYVEKSGKNITNSLICSFIYEV